jgi:hypothetical protein
MLMKMSLFAWAFWRLLRGWMGMAVHAARRLRRLWVKQQFWPRRPRVDSLSRPADLIDARTQAESAPETER